MSEMQQVMAEMNQVQELTSNLQVKFSKIHDSLIANMP